MRACVGQRNKMASLLHSMASASASASASALVDKRTLFFRNPGIFLATARAVPLRRSCSSRPLVLRCSTEGVPAEILEDSKFAPLNEDYPVFGPPAMLLMGLSSSDVMQVRQILNNMQGDFLKVIIYTEDMLNGSVWDAVNTSQPDPTKVKGAQGVPRICLFSGLTAQEIMMFLDSCVDKDMEPIIYAAVVPNNAQKTIKQVVEEILDDHERMKQSRTSTQSKEI